LLYAAEDAPEHIQQRLHGVASARGLDLCDLQIRLILAPSLRLDTARDRARLRKTLDEERPRLLILDPLVRLHQADENSAAEMSSLLGELRALQRQYELAVLLVHHLRKNAPRAPDGQALRGSGDLHAWGDSNLYLRRRDTSLRLTVEHRSAPSPEPSHLELALEPAPHLRVIDADTTDHAENVADLAQRVLAALATADKPLSRDALRESLRTRNSTLGDTLARLRAERRIVRADNGFVLRCDPQATIPVPAST
ncbi:MAG: AAA family ATPase, partial [Candidatus Binatia bacterium]